MLKKIFIIAFCGIISLILPLFPIQATYDPAAIDPETPYAEAETTITQTTGLGARNPVDTANLIINWALTLLGIFFLVLVIYGGFIWMNARGNEQEVERAINLIKSSVIGLIIILISYGITNLIFTVVANISQSGALH